MFGGLTELTEPPGTDFGEQMINAVAAQSLRHLFTRSESIEVLVRCFPSFKLLQGMIDSFQMQGRGLVIRRDFLVEKMSFQTDAVAVDGRALLGGSLRLRQPTQATAEVVLTESAINQAFKAELVTRRLTNLTLPELDPLAGGQPVSFQDVSLALLPHNQVKIQAKVDLPGHPGVPISLRATLGVERRRRIVFQNPQFCAEEVPTDQQSLAGELTRVFGQILNTMVDLDRFDLDGIELRINRLETRANQLVFSGFAQIRHFPGSK